MDTKSKHNKGFGVFLSVASLACIAALCMIAMQPIYQNSLNAGSGFYNTNYFLRTVLQSTCSLYWDAQEAWQDQTLPPAEVLLDMEDGDAWNALRVTSALDAFNESVRQYSNFLRANWPNLHYIVQNDVTGQQYTNADAAQGDLRAFIPRSGYTIDASLFRYALVLQFDNAGNLSYVSSYTGSTESGAENYSEMLWRAYENVPLAYNIPDFNQDALTFYDLVGPRNTTFVYAVLQEFSGSDWISATTSNNQLWTFIYGGFSILFFSALCVALLLGLWFARRKGRNLGGRLAHIPLEIILAAGVAITSLLEMFGRFVRYVLDGSLAAQLLRYGSYPLEFMQTVLNFSIFFAWLAILGVCFLAALSLAQGLRGGWKPYLRRNWLVWRFFAWLGRMCKKVWRVITDIDLSSPAEKTLLKLLSANFVILTLICSIWFFGIIALVIYTVAMFFLLRKRFAQTQRDYNTLVATAQRMADGDLNARVSGDLGMFNTLKEELNKVQDGFQSAVEAEVRSQNMKTELITNVSHDLKTPLTAIITYVDLLKNPDLPEADRLQYIATLDKKSQRLKRLIEDLFEVSKATTKNVTMQFDQVDVCALLKQVQYELADKLDACAVDFRWSLTDEKILAMLDGQKTYRIFENLLVNITKYAMPHTRAYISVAREDEQAVFTFKNVSATELDFDESAITERFMRGDKSRNTEGSGLGLAIVKSFTELQNGSFAIQVDGDLFKAVLRLPCLPPAPLADGGAPDTPIALAASETAGALPVSEAE